jgi:hypothetical protein
MSNLDKALAEITAIRGQMARASQFRGYGPATFAITGTLAAMCAVAQSIWLPLPSTDMTRYLALWIAAASAAALLVGVEMITRSRRFHSDLADDMIRAAIEQFLPVGVAGALLTAVLVWANPPALWMLPGLWQILFSVGIFSSLRFLPRALAVVAAWYLASGLACIAFGSGVQALAPWTMGIGFGIGQWLFAGLLHHSLGDGHE